jgi:predicted RNA-binding Zn-ribbon protein involved in translation (DUF1610 family)
MSRDQYGLSDSYDSWRTWTPDQDATDDVPCYNCGEEIYMDDMTYVDEVSDYVCDSCLLEVMADVAAEGDE